MASTRYHLLLFVLGFACRPIEASWDSKDWTDAINTFFVRFLADFNDKDWDSVARSYTADAHLLVAGNNVVVGRDAIAEAYRSIDSARNGTFVAETLGVTSLRYYSESWAVAEYGFVDIGNGKLGLGVIVFKMEDGELKHDTDIFYEL